MVFMLIYCTHKCIAVKRIVLQKFIIRPIMRSYFSLHSIRYSACQEMNLMIAADRSIAQYLAKLANIFERRALLDKVTDSYDRYDLE
jgi:hypothetical protein